MSRPTTKSNASLHTRTVALTTTPVQLNTTGKISSGIAVQMAADAAVDVRLGGTAAELSSSAGWLLVSTPATSPTSKPDEWSQTLAGADVWARTVSGTCNVTVLEAY